ncbi:MAG: CcdB family protein [Amaricoccus sp.]|uniref:CcdB family protein n=1 Tax=Amaricoccus sp. TaxID=1872485 RepID=UPI0039E28CB1
MPRRFDVFRTPEGTLVTIAQNDLLDAMSTRVVLPLLPAGSGMRPARTLNPEVLVGGEAFVLLPQLAATLTIAALGVHVGSIAAQRDAVTRAIDMLLSGI